MRDPEDDPAKREETEQGSAPSRIDRAFVRLRASGSSRSRRDKHRVAAALFGDDPPESEAEPAEAELSAPSASNARVK